MRRTIIIIGVAVIVLNCVGLVLLKTPSTHAKISGFTDDDLWGTYASQLTGTVNVPQGHPWFAFNGPYALTGRVYADGLGNAKGTVYDNYNGTLVNYSWVGTYKVNNDGTLMLKAAVDLTFIKFDLQMFGVLCDEGKQVRLMHVGPAQTSPMGLPWVGTTIIGWWIRSFFDSS